MLLLSLEQKKIHVWKNYLPEVLNAINFTKKKFRSKTAFLKDYFLSPVSHVPHIRRFFRFTVGETVRVDVPLEKRKSLSFKYSLRPGKVKPA